MGYKITIEVDSAEELDYILSNWKTEGKEVMIKQVGEGMPQKAVGKKTANDFRNLYKVIANDRPKQYKILQILFENPEGLSDTELTSRVDLSTKNALGGTLSGFKWQGKKFGLETWDIIDREMRKDTRGKEFYFYKLTPQVREIMEQSKS